MYPTLDTCALMNMLPHKKEYQANLIEPVIAEAMALEF